MQIDSVQKNHESRSRPPRHRVRVRTGLCALALAALAATLPARDLRAQEVNAPTSETLGSVTNLPLPRFVSLKTSEGNVRRGPSLTHRIDWVFTRRGMPLEITAEYGHWRRVRDRDGQGGWVHYALLSGVRSVLVEEDMMRVHARPDANAPVMAAFEIGVVAQLGACVADWCEISAGSHEGWAPKSKLWGVKPDELRE